jgi:Sulfotransferase family
LSVWRSGSSLLHALLNQHSKIALLYEGELPQLQLLLWPHIRNGAWRKRWEFWNRGPSRHGLAIDAMPTTVSSAWEATSVVYREFARRKGATIWGEKSPHWYGNALHIARKFPEAQFIFLWRDPNAVMASIAHAAVSDRFFRKPGFTSRVLVGTEMLKKACEALRAQGRSVYEISFEDLTSNTAICMRGICEFLKVDFEDPMASLAGADRSATFSGEHHASVRGNQIIAGRVKRVDMLSPRLKAKIARYSSRWKQRYGEDLPSSIMRPTSTRPPGALEIVADRLKYRALLCGDNLVKIAYAVAPLGFAESARSWLRRRTFKTIPSVVARPVK